MIVGFKKSRRGWLPDSRDPVCWERCIVLILQMVVFIVESFPLARTVCGKIICCQSPLTDPNSTNDNGSLLKSTVGTVDCMDPVEHFFSKISLEWCSKICAILEVEAGSLEASLILILAYIVKPDDQSLIFLLLI